MRPDSKQSTPYVVDTASLDIGDLGKIRDYLLVELNSLEELKADIITRLSLFLDSDELEHLLDDADKYLNHVELTPVVLYDQKMLGVLYYIYKFHRYDLANNFQSNQEVLLDAIERNASAFKHASVELQNDINFIKKSLEKNGLVLKSLSVAMQNDDILVTKAVEQNGKALQYAGDKFKANQVIINIAIKQNAEAFLYITPELQNNQEYVLEAISYNPMVIAFLDPQFVLGRNIILEAIKNNPWVFKHLPAEFQDDIQIASEAISQEGDLLHYAGIKIRDNKEIALQAIESHPFSFLVLSNRLQQDMDIILGIIAKRGTLIRFLPPEALDDTVFMLEVVEKMQSSIEILSVEEIIMLHYTKKQFLCFASERLQADAGFVLDVLRRSDDIDYIRCASESLLNNKQFFLGVRKFSDFPLHYIGSELREDVDFIIKILGQINRNSLCDVIFEFGQKEKLISYILEISIPYHLCLAMIDYELLEYSPELEQKYEKARMVEAFLDITEASREIFDISNKVLELRLKSIEPELDVESAIKCFINHFEYWGDPQFNCPNAIPKFISDKFDLFLDSMYTKTCYAPTHESQEVWQDLLDYHFGICSNDF